MQSYPIIKDLVLLGGGHSHVSVIKSFGMNPLPGLQVTLISPDVHTPYSGMLPGFVAGHYSEEDIHIDLVALCRFAGVRFIRDRAIGVDTQLQNVQTQTHPDIAYDVLSIDIGITPVVDTVPGAKVNVIPVKPVHEFVNRWAEFLSRISQSEVKQNEVKQIGIVGAGAGGVELCLAIYHRIKKDLSGKNADNELPEMHLLSDGNILQGHNKAVRNTFLRVLKEKHISYHSDFQVVSIESHSIASKIINSKTITSKKGENITLDEIFWVTHAASQPWLGISGLSVDEQGFVRVKDTLQTLSHANIFAVGDVAKVINHPRPRAGVFAVRQGPPLARNLRRVLLGFEPVPFKPQSRFLSLIAKGEKSAVASRGRLKVEGKWVWQWKNWIDQRFMKKFNCLPEMKTQLSGGLVTDEDDQTQCGGCGAKLGADMLSSVLWDIAEKYKINKNIDPNVLVGLSEPDDAAVLAVPQGKVLVQTSDLLRTFIDDPYVFARIGFYHATSDLYAMGVVPHSAQVMVTLPFGRPKKLQELLKQIMSGVVETTNEEGVSLIGGHTGEGAELSLGFTVNGYADESEIWLKSGLKAGDRLILTKPLGTGALLAADMHHEAKGQWIQSATDEMLNSSKQAMKIFKRHGIQGCTDVTGFGLAGHLLEMLKASHLDAEVYLDELPIMNGACEVINDKGIKSSLHQTNQLAEKRISNSNLFREHRNYALLFDPQTSGGLLASVHKDQAFTCVEALQKNGYPCSKIIGRVVEADNGCDSDGGTIELGSNSKET